MARWGRPSVHGGKTMQSMSAGVLTPERVVQPGGPGHDLPSTETIKVRRSQAPAAGPSITVLVPAHDEGHQILATLEGLRQQTLRPDRVVVVADNCSDDTASLARMAGAEVYETVGNQHKKAGALNQAWS